MNLIDDYTMKSTQPFKLKNKVGKIFRIIDMKEFGERPDFISVEKLVNQKNVFIVRGFFKKEK